MGYFEVEKIPLKVLTDEGFDVETGVEVKETRLLFNTETNNTPTFYFNSGDSGIEFEISILVKPTYRFGKKPISYYLNMWNKLNTVVTVVTEALDVPSSKYTLQIKNKKQTSKHNSIWKLRFKQYYENELSFETNYLDKNLTISAPALILQRYNEINSSSPKDAIYALQVLLMQRACFRFIQENGNWIEDRVPTGVWDEQMTWDIFTFQAMYGLDTSKQGKCDRETIIALIKDSLNVGYYDQVNREYTEL